MRVAVSAADRLFQDGVDDAEPGQVLRRDLHVGRGFLRLGRIAPQDRGGGFRRDHAVDRVFQHQHPIGSGDGDGAARTAFADDDGDVRHPKRQASVGGTGDRLGLTTFLGADAGIGAGGVDQRQHRKAETVRHLHQPHRLAVAFGPGHAEIMLEPGFSGRALFLAEDADAFAAKPAEPADQRLVLAELAVACQRREFGDQRIDVIDAMRPLRVPRHLRLLPGRQRRIEFVQRLSRLVLDPRDFVGNIAAAGGKRAQFVDPGVQFGDGLFEIEIAAHGIGHSHQILGRRRQTERAARGGRNWTRRLFKSNGPVVKSRRWQIHLANQ